MTHILLTCIAFQIPSHHSTKRLLANNNELDDILTARLPTSVDDQVRQARVALANSPNSRHLIRLLLPIIGATELDDWPGGSRQQMQAAYPLVESILDIPIQNTITVDDSDGVVVLMGQGESAADDTCAVLLPTAESLAGAVLPQLEPQMGSRNLILVNPQYRRRTDFGGVFGRDEKTADYSEGFTPTFSLTSVICEGESVRVLRAHPSPWRIFRRDEDEFNGEVHWVEVGQKPFEGIKPTSWNAENTRDGGMLFNYGQPSYQDIALMLTNAPDYKPKNPAERAAAAFKFIKDSL